MRIAKRIALTTIAALAALAMTATTASAGIAEGEFEGTMVPYSDYVGLPLACDNQSFIGEIYDGASEPATGAINDWVIDDCYAYGPVGCHQGLPVEIEVYDNGTVRLLDFARQCQVGSGASLTSPVVEAQLGCDGHLVFHSESLYLHQTATWIGWDAPSWNVTGLEVENPPSECESA